MINFKLGAVAAALGFLLSLMVGLLTGAGLFALVRALLFGAFFFVLACGLYIAVSRFLPELLELSASPGTENEPGSRVNISVEGDVGSGAFDFASPAGRGAEEAGFDPGAPIPNAALDQLGEDAYTREGASAGPAPAAGPGFEAPVFETGAAPPIFESGPLSSAGSPVPPEEGAALPGGADNPDSVDVLPDLEAMSQAFLASTQEAEQGGGEAEGENDPFEGGGPPDTKEGVFEVSVSGRSRAPAPYIGNKPVALEGDFPPKDIAQALQTILKRE
ncbi:MAG: hypothetical protein LBQ35_02835 [Spirochaetaceae bacterium]|jgi:hypothetical protein|nr:hypothetical protein [Spirochaetaceae bacterium]